MDEENIEASLVIGLLSVVGSSTLIYLPWYTGKELVESLLVYLEGGLP